METCFLVKSSVLPVMVGGKENMCNKSCFYYILPSRCPPLPQKISREFSIYINKKPASHPLHITDSNAQGQWEIDSTIRIGFLQPRMIFFFLIAIVRQLCIYFLVFLPSKLTFLVLPLFCDLPLIQALAYSSAQEERKKKGK